MKQIHECNWNEDETLNENFILKKVEENLSDDKSITGALFKVPKLRKAIINATPFELRLVFTRTILEDPKFMQPFRVTCKFIPSKLRWVRAITVELKPKKPKNIS